MEQAQKSNVKYFDNHLQIEEQLPRKFTVSFREIKDSVVPKVEVCLNNQQIGNTVDDNCFENDFYRYHDIFHYTFATVLGWSPCARSMMKRKRKSDSEVDRVEDGARAAITEEAISLIIFSEAKKKLYFANGKRISRTTLKFIKSITEDFEVRNRSIEEWELAIMKAYSVFRQLIKNGGGEVQFNMVEREVRYCFLKN